MNVKVMQLQTGSGYSGGIANYISALIKSKAFGKYSNYVVAPGARITPIKSKNNFYPHASVHDLPQSYSIFSIIPYLISVYKILKNEKISILHSHALRSGFIASVISFFLEVKVVHTTHGLRYTQKNMVGRLFSFLIESFVLTRADYVIAIRKTDFRMLLKRFDRFKHKVKFIPTRLAKISEFSSRKYDGNELKIISVGSLIEIKRPEKFVRWIQELNRHGVVVSATWVGDGPLMSHVKKLAMINKVNISFPGQMSKNEVAIQMKNAHFLFLTSEYEVMPLSVIESYSCGLPVIANYFIGVEDFVENEKTGLIVRENENFVDRVIPLISNSKQFNKMSVEANKKFVTEFSDSELMAREYTSIYGKF